MTLKARDSRAVTPRERLKRISTLQCTVALEVGEDFLGIRRPVLVLVVVVLERWFNVDFGDVVGDGLDEEFEVVGYVRDLRSK